MTPKPDAQHRSVDPEPVIEPELEIIDPHHHLWDLAPQAASSPFLRGMPFPRYLLPELLADVGDGHRVTRTVFVEARAFYRADGPDELRPVGEVEFANGVAAMSASGRYGETQLCAGIVAYADLTLGGAVVEVLEAARRAAGNRLRGVRMSAAYDETGSVPTTSAGRGARLYSDDAFRAGFACLQEYDLSFDAWLFSHQLGELVGLAAAFPEQPIVLDHVGTPLGVGVHAGRRVEIYQAWLASIRQLSRHPNVHVKLGGLGMSVCGFQFRDPPTSEALAAAWRPYLEPCIEAFGAERCMFESNFPVDSETCSYRTLWNALKRIAAGASAEEKASLFSHTARRFYRLR